MRVEWKLLVGAVIAAVASTGMPTAASAAPALAAVAGAGAPTSLAAAAGTTNSNGGEYVSLTPARIENSVDALGTYAAPLSGPGKRSYVISGRGGVPASGVSAVAVQVTIANATAKSYATVWAAGQTQPTVSQVSVQPDEDASNVVITALGAGGAVEVFLNAGSADVLIDVHGYYTTPSSTTAAGSFQVVSPTRLADSRIGLGIGTGRVGPGQTRTLQVTGVSGVPTSGVQAVALNVVMYQPTTLSYATVWDASAPRPAVSNVNAEPLTDTAGMVQVKVSPSGQVSLYNNAGDVDLVVDLAGYYLAATEPDAAAFVPLTPTRILSTITGHAVPAGPLLAGSTLSVPGRGALDAGAR